LREADSESFVVVKEQLGKDSDKVYNHDRILEGLDAGEVELLGDVYIRDKNTLYYYRYGHEIKVEGVNVLKFHLVFYGDGKEGKVRSYSADECGTDGQIIICSGQQVFGGKILEEKQL